ncbi:MAG: ATP-binding protein [Pseudomonadota bacterium]
MHIESQFNEIKNKTRFSILFAIPLFLILLFSVIGLSEKYSQYKNVIGTEYYHHVNYQLSNLLNSLQKERGLSEGYIASGKKSFKKELSEQRKQTNKNYLLYGNSLRKFSNFSDDTALKKYFDRINSEYSKIVDIREYIDKTTDNGKSFAYYSKLNALIINTTNLYQIISKHNLLSHEARSFSKLLWLQEYIGQERGALNAVFYRKRLSPESFYDISGYIHSQKNVIRDYKMIATPSQQKLLQVKLSNNINYEVYTMRNAAVNLAIRLDLLNQIQRKIGYNGLIHDFKNFLIRGDNFYLNRFKLMYQKLQLILNDYRQLSGISKEELDNLHIIEDTFLQYSSHLEIMSSMRKDKKMIVAIDKIVKIDDTLPAIAFESLRMEVINKHVQDWWEKATERVELIKQGSDQISQDLTIEIQNIKSDIKYALYFYSILIFVTLFISWLIRGVIIKIETAKYKALLAKKEAETANKFKSQFLTTMSHELRTPLNAILGFSELLSLDVNKTITVAQHRNIDKISKAGEHLLALINDILDLSKIESGQLNLSITNVSIGDVLFESLTLINPIAEKRGISIQKFINGNKVKLDKQQPNIQLQVDYTRLKQAIINLLSNAVKYNKDNGSIIISCDVFVEKNLLRMSIKDTGQGISKEKQDKLFKPFERLGAEATTIDGTGIGLVITKKIIEQMGGRIGVESTLNNGSTFWLEFPYTKVENG